MKECHELSHALEEHILRYRHLGLPHNLHEKVIFEKGIFYYVKVLSSFPRINLVPYGVLLYGYGGRMLGWFLLLLRRTWRK